MKLLYIILAFMSFNSLMIRPFNEGSFFLIIKPIFIQNCLTLILVKSVTCQSVHCTTRLTCTYFLPDSFEGLCSAAHYSRGKKAS